MKIALASLDDIDAIQCFIRDNWKENHILARDKSFFMYEMTQDCAVNYMIAKDDDSNIVGLLGFVPSRRDISTSNLFFAILRVLDEYAKSGLGLKLIQKCRELTSGTVNVVGINDKVWPLYKFLGFHVDYLEHYYWINPNITDFHICKYDNQLVFSLDNKNDDYFLIEELSEGLFSLLNSRRDYYTFTKQYLNNPYYDYLLYYSKVNNSLLVCREELVDSHKALKIIDYHGDYKSITKALNFLKGIVIDNGYEFVDIYANHIISSSIIDSGYQKNTYNDDVIIPNYYSPFVKSNIKIAYATCDRNLLIMRGDGDQDRPS
ncbi:hypothetical protein PVK63_09200 [Aliivibrio sp. S2TY2]|uniref:GNAT family N-acetyltransferase n=1 Tax=unclassified Aliivibrio TaxID=2645654 RepID=UPI0023792DA1|nr:MULTISPECIES: GNAT family N-acetyltransferase [unclassified Aliivibrio]MDD9174926.1 hypothetical protein [Aliivibrio sp. S3TY1]MDD9192127.1 hypothetical protein [Aliivibrio sp. S2TY2]